MRLKTATANVKYQMLNNTAVRVLKELMQTQYFVRSATSEFIKDAREVKERRRKNSYLDAIDRTIAHITAAWNGLSNYCQFLSIAVFCQEIGVTSSAPVLERACSMVTKHGHHLAKQV